MVTKKTSSDRKETKQFVVNCNDCSFERTADGRDEAAHVGDGHRRETGHTLVAIEAPPSREFS